MDSRLDEARAALVRAEEAVQRPPSARLGAAKPAQRTRQARAANATEPGEALPPDPRADAEADPEAVARAIVLRQLTLGPRSRAQLEEKLRSRGCPESAAEAVLDRLTEVGLVDDQAYAHMMVNAQTQRRGLARRALSHELRRKGIDDEAIADAIAQINPADEEERARELVTKKLRTLHGLDADVQKRRLAAMLARKGYSSSMSRRVIREELDRAPEHRRD